MKKEIVQIKLIINSHTVKVGQRFLEDISNNIQDIKENKKIFDILSMSDNYTVRENISRNDNLSSNTVERLLNDENDEIVENILSNRTINKFITNKQLKRIIKKGSIKLLCLIASRVNEYQNTNMCKITKLLAKHPNQQVRLSIFNWNVPDVISIKTLKRLSKDTDLDIRYEAKKVLKDRLEK